MEYEAIIGLEVHAQLKTQSKIFCPCSTEFGAPPNANTCPVCLGLPGVLPVLNRNVVSLASKACLALNCTIQKKSVWARKNYFYPDLPKGYQISQYEEPLALKGHLMISLKEEARRIGITRIHMEEDAGKLLHDQGDIHASHVDLNRAGVPLIEIVSEPDLRSAEEATLYLKQIRSILRYCDVCDGNMEEGSLRCDANVSVRPRGQKELGTKVELKNMNSFRFVEKAIDYEIKRQATACESGGKIAQETRLWDTKKGQTETMRSKEYAHDYRYFPDPDLVPLIIEKVWIENVRKEMPELPQARAERFVNEFQLPVYDAGVLTAEKSLADFFERAVRAYNNPKKISNWIMTEFLAKLNEKGRGPDESPVKAEQVSKLIELIDKGTISGKIAKDVFEEMMEGGKDPEEIIKKKNLTYISDTGSIEKVIDSIMAQNLGQLEQYRSGRDKLFGFFVGQVMKEMKGQANPQVVNELLRKKLS